MLPFASLPPPWVDQASHASGFCCARCGAAPQGAKAVWINRRAPVYTESHQRKWQEFYLCDCDHVWWAWSSDRPPTDLSQRHGYTK